MSDLSSPPSDQLSTVTLSLDEVPKAEFSDRVPIQSIIRREDGGSGLAGKKARIGGWVKTGRKADKDAFAFLQLNDGTCAGNLQVIVEASLADLGQLVLTGTCVVVDGYLKLPPSGEKQNKKIELRADKVLHVGPVDPAKYPLPKLRLTPDKNLEFLRNFVHLRSRTNTISAVARIGNALAYATHTFFNKHGFLYVRTPIVTTSDCEGAGEMFQVTTLFSEAERLEKELIQNPPPTESDVEAAKLVVQEKGEVVSQLKTAEEKEKEITAAVDELKKAKRNVSKLEERSKLQPSIPRKDGKIDYAKDFFARQAFLTVSGQLQVESYACALSSVYTFGPTFRAENSHTSRHLAEFWMVEPEIAFADLEDDMKCAEAYVKFLCQWLLDNCLEDMEFMADKGCIDRLKMVASTPFIRLTYTEAVEILEEAVKNGTEFENEVKWGIDLASEHERYLTEVKYQKKPVIVYNYPKGEDIKGKAFYMRLNDDLKTVAAMDVLVPNVGELIGGGQREERYDVIQQRLKEMDLPVEPYEWYIDLRRYGTVKHAGFGLGFERMILFATGLKNIRDVIPFPRYPGRADL
ncbi:cytoplasmic asparagine-tRNA ligase [Medicago truncatula]|uniref:asparagine--tRNA ligase n=1 Tax=Medicago truncatula TaxID=3880 RepID=G7L2R6_MEDTR|nr:cytoplasmic asparagine-tRNA ligase [Medicago truncatula]